MQFRAIQATLAGVAILAMASAGQTESADPSPAAGAAATWLGMLDHGRWVQSWAASGALFHRQSTAQQWGVMAGAVRSPLGATLSRKLTSERKTDHLPGAPDGDYAVLHFATRFAHKAAAVETVVLAREAGAWKVDGYFIQ